jgi:hypothetical protein
MNSWDCFDTLIARKHYHPKTVFDEVGRRIGDPNFKAKRVAAEKASNKTYADIYARLPGINPQVELDVELEHNFPIMENMLKVKDGDIIISDMYLPAEFVEALLRKCGLTKQVKVIVTPDGKKKGWIWDTLDISKIDSHFGDNKKSDIDSAAARGINAIHCTQYDYSEIEHLVVKFDTNLANWMRYTRLQCPYIDDRKYIWQNQANINLPVLALATLELPDKKIAFTYRDCHNWHRLYEKMTNKKGIRLDCSRAMYSNPNKYFDRFMKQIKSKDCVIVDLQGKGYSIWNYFGQQPPETIYIGGRTLPYVTRLTEYQTKAMEKHNCWTEGSTVDWNALGPVKTQNDHPVEVANVQIEAFNIGIDVANIFRIKKNLELLSDLVKYYNYNNFTNKNVYWHGEHYYDTEYAYNSTMIKRKGTIPAAVNTHAEMIVALNLRVIKITILGASGTVTGITEIQCTKFNMLIPNECWLKKDKPEKGRIFVWDVDAERWRSIHYKQIKTWS